MSLVGGSVVLGGAAKDKTSSHLQYRGKKWADEKKPPSRKRKVYHNHCGRGTPLFDYKELFKAPVLFRDYFAPA